VEHLGVARQLRQNGETIRSIVEGISLDQARWKPTTQDWSILEVINHLYDEEREDFRRGLDYVLHRPGEEAPPIDPMSWVTARSYNQRELAASVQNFLAERQQSVAWLERLTAPDWAKSQKPPQFEIRAGDLLSSWLAHDFLHLRQLVELHYAWVKMRSAPYSLDYAGDW
jgi:hypothetical protein